MVSTERNEHDDDARKRDPSAQTAVRLVASGSRWVCLKDEHAIVMLDVLTGRPAWSCPVTMPDEVFANERCVVVLDKTNERATALDRRSGQQIEHHLTPDDVRRIVSTSRNDFVLQQQDADEPGRLRLTWRNAVTNVVSRVVDVRNVVNIQRSNESQLVAFSDDGTLSVVDLKTANVREYRWSDETIAESDAQADADEEPQSWSPDQIRFFEDQDFVYLVHQTNAAQTNGRIPERQLTPLHALRALNRHTREYLWEIRLTDSQDGVMVTDQLNLPFLVLIDQSVPNRQREETNRLRLRCLNKGQGRPLIDRMLPSRYSYDELRISANSDYSVSAEIHGTHIRFELPESPSISPPNATEARAD